MKPDTDLDAVFQALSDPTRRKILGILRRGDRSTGNLAERFPMTRPAVSSHLRVLYDAGLVDRRKEGRNQLYTLASGALRDARMWLELYAAEWRQGLGRLKTHIEEEVGHPDDSSPNTLEEKEPSE